jgi:hypothetical protein
VKGEKSPAVLAKPFASAQLIAAVAEALGGPM